MSLIGFKFVISGWCLLAFLRLGLVKFSRFNLENLVVGYNRNFISISYIRGAYDGFYR